MMQNTSQSLNAHRALLLPLRHTNRHARPCRAVTPQVRAGLVLPQNPIGIHSGVFVGDWKPQDAERAVKGAKEAGYDLIERRFLITFGKARLNSYCRIRSKRFRYSRASSAL